MRGRPLEGEHLQPIAQTDAVRLGEADVRRLVPLDREAGQRFGTDGDTKLRGMSRSEAEQIPEDVQSTLIRASRLILQRGSAPAPTAPLEEDPD